MRENLAVILPTVILVLLLPIMGGVAVTLGRVSDQQAEIKQGAIENCERTNDARVASINEKHGSVKTLRKQIHATNKQLGFWLAALDQSRQQVEASPLADLFFVFIQGLREERDALRAERNAKLKGIADSIAAQADVAVRSGSPVVDCALANR